MLECECGKTKINSLNSKLKRICNICNTEVKNRDNTKQTTLNSLEAYHILKDTKEIGNRQQQVIMALDKLKSANNRMIAEYLKLPINTITPRVKELRDNGIIQNGFLKVDEITQRTTTYWSLA